MHWDKAEGNNQIWDYLDWTEGQRHNFYMSMSAWEGDWNQLAFPTQHGCVQVTHADTGFSLWFLQLEIKHHQFAVFVLL